MVVGRDLNQRRDGVVGARRTSKRPGQNVNESRVDVSRNTDASPGDEEHEADNVGGVVEHLDGLPMA